MINMIRAERYRLTKTKGFYIFWILILTLIAVDVLTNSVGGIGLGMGIPEGVTYSKDIMFLSTNMNFYFFLLMPVFSIVIGEFTNNIVKNTISSAVNKSRYFVYKYIICMVYGVLVFLFSNFLFYGLRTLFHPANDPNGAFDVFVSRMMSQLPLIIALLSVFIMVAFLLRKGAAYNSALMLTPFLFMLVVGILGEIPGVKDSSLLLKLEKYELSQTFMHLGIRDTILDFSNFYRNVLIICAVATIGSFLIGYYTFKKRELR